MGKKLIGALLAGSMMSCVCPSFASREQKKGAFVLHARTTLALVPTFVYDKRLVQNPDFKKWHQCDVANWKLFASLRPAQPYLPKTCRQGVIRGLTAKDFHLFQDDEEQKIESATLEDWSVVVRDSLTWHYAFSLTPVGQWITPDLGRDPFSPDPRGPLYLLTYVPPKAKPGSCHKIRVKVDRPNALIFARDEYCVGEAPSDPLYGTKRGRELEADLASGRHGKLHLSLQAGYLYGPGGKALIDLAVSTPWKSLERTWDMVHWKLRARIGVLGEIRKQDGTIAARFSDLAFPSYWPTFVSGRMGVLGSLAVNRRPLAAMPVRNPALAGESTGSPLPQLEPALKKLEPGWVPNRYETQVLLPPGSYDLRVAISDGKNFGHAEMSLVIDKPVGKQLALSSLILCKRLRDAAVAATEAAAGNFAPRQVPLVSKSIQVAPAADTRFRKGENMIAYFDVDDPLLAAKATTPVEAYMRLLDATTGKVWANFAPFDARSYEQPGSPVIRIAREIPIKRLPKGAYRLEVRAADSVRSTPWRTADFTVTAKNPASR